MCKSLYVVIFLVSSPTPDIDIVVAVGKCLRSLSDHQRPAPSLLLHTNARTFCKTQCRAAVVSTQQKSTKKWDRRDVRVGHGLAIPHVPVPQPALRARLVLRRVGAVGAGGLLRKPLPDFRAATGATERCPVSLRGSSSVGPCPVSKV